MDMKLFDSELKVMEILWREGHDLPAGQIAAILRDEIGWNRNTTYTVIKKCVAKGAVERRDPKFICHASVTRQQVQSYKTEELIDKMFDGSRQKFLTAFISDSKLTADEAEQLKEMITGISSQGQ